MLNEQRKLLISSYIDGETTPDETAQVRHLLETSKTARDYFQGQLLVARRVRQALRLDPPAQQFETAEVLREIFSRPQVLPAKSIPSYQRRPIWVAVALAGGIAICAGIGAFYPTRSIVPENAKPQEVALEKGRYPEALWSSDVGATGEHHPLVARLPDKIPSPELPSGDSLKVGDSLVRSLGVSEPSGLKETTPVNETDPSPIPSEILASPIGPSQTLKRIDLVLPTVFKAKALDPNVLSDREMKGIVRLDLPTYQENEAIKRLMATLKAEGCGSFLDPLVEEKIRRNIPVGPVVIVVQGLDPAKVCRVIQGTSKIGISKTAPNQPNSVFDEVIVGNLSVREAEAIPGVFAPNTPRNGASRKSGEPDNTQKSPKGNSPLGAFATIASVSAIRIPGVVAPRKVVGKTAFDSAKPPVVLNIVPLR